MKDNELIYKAIKYYIENLEEENKALKLIVDKLDNKRVRIEALLEIMGSDCDWAATECSEILSKCGIKKPSEELIEAEIESIKKEDEPSISEEDYKYVGPYYQGYDYTDDKQSREIWHHGEYVAEMATSIDAGRIASILKDAEYKMQEYNKRIKQLEEEKRQLQTSREGWSKISNDQYKRIGKALDPIREKRYTGEPAKSDAYEIEKLVRSYHAIEKIPNIIRDRILNMDNYEFGATGVFYINRSHAIQIIDSAIQENLGEQP